MNETANFIYKRSIGEAIKNGKSIINKNFPGIILVKEKQSKSSLLVTPKNDDISRTCPLGLRRHSSNQIYFQIYFSGDVLVRCFKCTGSISLSNETKIFDDIKNQVEISSKPSKRQKCKNTYKPLPEIVEDQRMVFIYDPIAIKYAEVLDFYEAMSFVYVPAKLDQKRPVLSGWTKCTKSDNYEIDLKKNNIAIVTGSASNIFVLDIDIKDGGLDWFNKFASSHKYNYTTKTTCVKTPSGGIHLYFLYDDSIPTNSVKMKDSSDKDIGLDIRSNDGCVIAPPSKYEKGEYSFVCLQSPQRCPEFIRKLFT